MYPHLSSFTWEFISDYILCLHLSLGCDRDVIIYTFKLQTNVKKEVTTFVATTFQLSCVFTKRGPFISGRNFSHHRSLAIKIILYFTNF